MFATGFVPTHHANYVLTIIGFWFAIRMHGGLRGGVDHPRHHVAFNQAIGISVIGRGRGYGWVGWRGWYGPDHGRDGICTGWHDVGVPPHGGGGAGGHQRHACWVTDHFSLSYRLKQDDFLLNCYNKIAHGSGVLKGQWGSCTIATTQMQTTVKFKSSYLSGHNYVFWASKSSSSFGSQVSLGTRPLLTLCIHKVRPHGAAKSSIFQQEE